MLELYSHVFFFPFKNKVCVYLRKRQTDTLTGGLWSVCGTQRPVMWRASEQLAIRVRKGCPKESSVNTSR